MSRSHTPVSAIILEEENVVMPDPYTGYIDFSGTSGVEFTTDEEGKITFSISGGGVTWSDTSTSKTVSSNTGHVSLAAATLTLPASPNNGDVVEFALGTSATLTVRANTGQSIKLGTVTSSSGGECSTSIQGNTLKLVYNTGSSTWISTTVIGNWVFP